jgi:cell division protein FtsW
MAKKVKPDRILFIVTLILVGFGVAMVFSSSAVVAKEKFGDPNYFSFKQLIFSMLGLAVMFVIMKVDYHRYRQPAVIFTFLAVVIALLVLAFFLSANANTYRWIVISGFSIQPSELAKLALILFLAHFLEKRKGKVNDFGFTLVPVGLIVTVLAGLIVLQRDLGTPVSLIMVAVVLLFVAGIDLRWLAACGICHGRAADLLHSDISRALSPGSDSCLPQSVGRPARKGISDHSVFDFGWNGRHYRAGLHGRQTETVLPAGSAHGFHLCRRW